MLFDGTTPSRKNQQKTNLSRKITLFHDIHDITHYTLADFRFSQNSTPFPQNDTHSMPRFSRVKTVFTCRITAPSANRIISIQNAYKNPETIRFRDFSFGMFDLF